MSALRILAPDGSIRLVTQGPCRPQPLGEGTIGGILARPEATAEDIRRREKLAEYQRRTRERRALERRLEDPAFAGSDEGQAALEMLARELRRWRRVEA